MLERLMFQALPFTKMHGLGNDFILVEKNDLPANINLTKLVQLAANRYIGIGCDQFIIYDLLKTGNLEMIIYNSDGSPAKACGNGSRCLASLYFEKSKANNITLKVGDRLLPTFREESGHITVNMGPVNFHASWMPSNEELRSLINPYGFDNVEIICADIGNPHLIIFSDLITGADLALLGPKLEKAPIFPDHVNVNFAKIVDNEIDLKVWERGAGFTFACGSGACATFATAHRLGFVGDKARVNYEFGSLYMTYQEGDILMTGPTKKTATGVLNYD